MRFTQNKKILSAAVVGGMMFGLAPLHAADDRVREPVVPAEKAVKAGGPVTVQPPVTAQPAAQPEATAPREATPPNALKQDAEKGAKAEPLAFPAGFAVKNLDESGDIRDRLATVAEDALQSDDHSQFFNNFVDQDRDRMKGFNEAQNAKLKAEIAVIKKNWEAKYGKEFDIDSVKIDALYPAQFAMLVTGEVSDVGLAVANFPVHPATGRPYEKSAEAIAAAAKEAKEVGGGDKNLDKGRNVALIRIPASHGLPTLTLSLIHELPDAWRFDIPNTRNADHIYNDLLSHLHTIAISSDKWPADVNEAYRAVTHRVLCAVYGVNPAPAGDAAKPGA